VRRERWGNDEVDEGKASTLPSKNAMVMKLALLAFCAAMIGSCSPKIDKQNAVDLPGGLGLSIERTPLRGGLPEHKRVAVLFSRQKKLASWDMFPDTGGTLRINVYQLDKGLILLRDRVSGYEIDPSSRSMAEAGGRIAKGKYLGCFDQDPKGTWRFLSAKQRPEIKITGDGRVE